MLQLRNCRREARCNVANPSLVRLSEGILGGTGMPVTQRRLNGQRPRCRRLEMWKDYGAGQARNVQICTYDTRNLGE